MQKQVSFIDINQKLYGLFNAKDIIVEEQRWCYLTHSQGG